MCIRDRIWEGGNLGNFELTLKARVKGNNNSGIQYRSKVLNAKTWSVGGYQMDMHPAPNYLGMMYEERGRGVIAQRGQNVVIDSKGKRTSTGNPDKEKTDNLADWNEFKISAIGNKLTHMVNGKVTVDIEDNEDGKKSSSGVIALQLHAGGPMRLEVKDISLVRKDKKTSKNLNPRVAENVLLVNAIKNPSVKWIWKNKSAGTETIYARRQWTLNSPLKSSKLSITCDNGFTAYVNGQKVGSGNQWEAHYEIDIKKYLSEIVADALAKLNVQSNIIIEKSSKEQISGETIRGSFASTMAGIELRILSVSYTHLTLPTKRMCRSRWSPYH